MLVDGAADHRIARALGHRHWFAGKHRLVHIALAHVHLAIDRYPLTRPDHHQVTRLHPCHRYLLLDAVEQDSGGLRLQSHQLADCRRRASLGQLLQVLAHQDHREHHRRRLEIEVAGVRRKDPGEQQHQQAVGPGGTGAGHHQAVHVGREVAVGGPARAKEAPPGAEDHRCGQHSLTPVPQALWRQREQCGLEPGHEVGAHGQDKDGEGQRGRHPQVPPHGQAARLADGLLTLLGIAFVQRVGLIPGRLDGTGDVLRPHRGRYDAYRSPCGR